MRQLIWSVTAVVAAWPAAPLPAQERALEQGALRVYVQEVLEHNAGYRAAGLRVDAATERIAPAGALPDPLLTVGAMSVPVTSFSVSREPMTQVPLIALQQRFPFPGKQGALAGVARADRMVADEALGVTEASLAAAAARAYFDLAYARTAVAIWQGRLALADHAIAVSQVRYETGGAPQTDLLRARLRRAQLDEEGDALEAGVIAAAARADALRAGVGDSIRPPFLVGPGHRAALAIQAAALPPDSMLVRQLREQSPALRVAAAEVERSEREARVFAIAARPDFMLSLQNGVRFGGREPFLTAMVGISVPLWAARKQSPAARAASLDAEGAGRRYDDLLARLEGELRAEAAVLRALAEQVRQSEAEILPLADGASASALQQYRVGAGGFTAVLDAQDDLFRAQLRFARLIADYGAARARLAALVGEEWYR